MKMTYGSKRLKSFRNKYLALLIIVATFLISSESRAQFTPSIVPDVDSVHKLVNRHVTNTAQTAFTELRINRILHNILYLLDTALTRTLLIPGIGDDSAQIRFNDTLFIYEVRKDTVWVPLLLSAVNGLTKTGDSVELGGTLYRATEIDQAGNGITFKNSAFTHGTGDFTGLASAYSILTTDAGYFDAQGGNGTATDDYRIYGWRNTTGGRVDLSGSSATGVAAIQIGDNVGWSSLVHLFVPTGNLRISGLTDSAQAYQLYINPTNWKVTYGLAVAGGGGGPGSGIGAVYATNGVTNVNDSTIELGGTLTKNTTINHAGFGTTWTGTKTSGTILSVTNLGAATAISASAVGGNHAIIGTVTGLGAGVSGISTTGFGGVFSSTDATAALFSNNPSSTNSIANLLEIRRQTSGTAANNIGAAINFQTETTSGLPTSTRLISKWTDATNATRTSNFEVEGVSSGTTSTVFTVKGTGQILLHAGYVAGTFDGAAVKGLGFDGSGNVVAYDAGGTTGGGGSDPTELDTDYFDGDGSSVTPYTPDLAVFAMQTDITTLHTRIDSLLNNFPTGALLTDIEDVNERIDSLLNDFPAGGAAEINTKVITLGTTGSLTMTVEGILEYILVKPTTSLAGFKIGTVADDDYFFTATPVTATSTFQEFVVQRYVPSSTAIYFSGITSSTQIKLVYKPMHQ